MHQHDHERPDLETADPSRPKVDAPDPLLVRAALAGRPDVLGSGGMLGLQRSAGNAAARGVVEETPSVQDVVSGSGSPLPTEVRGDMEARMGQDFSDVRVHTGDAADASARSVSAHAYTVGSNIVFQRGAYDPGSAAGQTMLAHELTHVVQQRNGPVDGTPIGGGLSVSDPSDRFEREAVSNAEAVMAAPAPVQRHAEHEEVQASHDHSLGPVQREAAPEEEELQAAHDDSLGPVQRQEAAEEEEELPT
ncbi:eCIS core domain-containing protein [Nocardioides sp. SYSU DS0651]|uniref:eCIS core domain-containing protein n=1 Tax=Nocardioides sp. SYSU DS0651 TaxID=3415955 RepID=UPI003F4B44F0